LIKVEFKAKFFIVNQKNFFLVDCFHWRNWCHWHKTLRIQFWRRTRNSTYYAWIAQSVGWFWLPWGC